MDERAPILTPELAAKMLDVCDRRRRDPRGTEYDTSVLEAALHDLPDHLPLRRGLSVRPRDPDSRWLQP